MKSLLAFCFAIVAASPAFSEDLYKTGQEAFQQKDYVTALKYLFAYRTLKSAELSQHPEFLRTLDHSISSSELILRRMQLSGTGRDIGVLGSAGGSGSGAQFTNTTPVVAARGYEIQELLRALDANGLRVVPHSAEGKRRLEDAIKGQQKQVDEMKSAVQLFDRTKAEAQGISREQTAQRP